LRQQEEVEEKPRFVMLQTISEYAREAGGPWQRSGDKEAHVDLPAMQPLHHLVRHHLVQEEFHVREPSLEFV
jgi:hypothetical protein